MYHVRLLILLGIITMSVLSCSTSNAPLSPDTSPPDIRTLERIETHRTLWGMWDICIDPETPTVEILPLRSLNFQANVVNHLQPPKAPVHMLTIDIDVAGSDFPSGLVNVDVTLNHPFPGTKFCGFDVMGIVMDDYDGIPWASDPSIISAMQPDTLLQNPDGWTRWWNENEFTSYGCLFGYIEGALSKPYFTGTNTLNAFKYFADGLESQDQFEIDPLSRGFFSSHDPGINTRHYELQFPVIDGSPVFHFKYAVSASWVRPDDDSVTPYTVEDYPFSANMPEAYKIDLYDNGSTAWYVNDANYGGDLDLTLDIYDWQLYGTISTAPYEIESITLESPSLFSGLVSIDPWDFESDVLNYTIARYYVHIADVTPSGLNDQLICITVNSVNPSTYAPQVTGTPDVDYPDGHLAAYNVIEVPISNEDPYPDPDWDFIVIDHPYNIWMTDCIFDQYNRPIVAVSCSDGGAMYHFYDWNGVDWDHDTPFGYADTGANCSIRMCYDPDWNLAAVWPNIHWNGANRDCVIDIRDHITSGWNYSVIDDSYCGGYFNVIDHDGTNYGVSYNINDAMLWFAYGQPGDWDKESVGQLIGDNCMDFVFDSNGYPYIVSTEYYSTGDHSLKVWYETTGIWEMLVLTNPHAICPRISAGPDGEMYIVYYKNESLMFATGSEGSWTTSTLVYGAGTGDINFLDELDIKTDSHGNPHVAYKDNPDGGVSYIYRDNAGWHDQFVAQSFEKAKLALALDSLDRPIIAYLGPDGLADLRVAWMH